MFAPLPQPEQIALPTEKFVIQMAMEKSFRFHVNAGHRAAKLLNRIYGPEGKTPHGFQNPKGFVEAARERNARSRMFKVIRERINQNAVRRGQLVEVRNGDEAYRLVPSEANWFELRIAA